MKTLPPALLAKYQSDTKTLCTCLLITRTDGFQIGLTSADIPVEVDGFSYLANPGLQDTNIVTSSGFNVDNLEIEFLAEDIYVTRPDVMAGKWNKAAFRLFRCDPGEPAAGVNVLLIGHLGDVSIRLDSYRAELRSVLQLLQQQTIGEVTSQTCKARLGDERCRVDLGPWTHSGTLTAITSRQVVTDAARLEVTDYFGEGTFTFTSGANEGVTVKVKDFAAGTFTFALPTMLESVVGDSYTAVAGCRKRLAEDCKAKFDNVLNFQGEPHLPGLDALTKAVEPSV